MGDEQASWTQWNAFHAGSPRRKQIMNNSATDLREHPPGPPSDDDEMHYMRVENPFWGSATRRLPSSRLGTLHPESRPNDPCVGPPPPTSEAQRPLMPR